jgi:hypothetical protein
VLWFVIIVLGSLSMKINRFFHVVAIVLLAFSTIAFGVLGGQLAKTENKISDSELFKRAN